MQHHVYYTHLQPGVHWFPWLIPLNDFPLAFWLTLDQYSIDISVKSHLIFHQCIQLGRHLADYQPNIYQVSFKMSIKCWLSVDRRLIVSSSRWQLTHAHNAFSTHDFSYIELCKKLIHVSWSIHDCQSCVRETRKIVLLLLYYYYYAWLHCKYLCMLLQWQFGIKFMNYKTNVLLAC